MLGGPQALGRKVQLTAGKCAGAVVREGIVEDGDYGVGGVWKGRLDGGNQAGRIIQPNSSIEKKHDIVYDKTDCLGGRRNAYCAN